MSRPIASKEEFVKGMEKIEKKLKELEDQLTSYREQVNLLIKEPKIRIIRITKSMKLHELKISENVTVISIPEIKEGLNSFFREYSLIKTKVNRSSSTRSSFTLSTKEEEESRDQKIRSNQLQINSNKINNDLNEFTLWLDEKIRTGEYEYIEGTDEECEDGGMIQIDPPSLQLDAGPADQSIDSVVDDLQGIVVLC